MMSIEDNLPRQAMLAAIIDSSEDAIISKDLASIVTSWNKAAERMFGYTEEEMIGKPIFKLIPKERWAEEEMIISSLKKGKRIEHFETVRLTKSGNKLQISLTVSPIRNDLGVVVGASKIARDITRQKEAEEAITQYAQSLEIINSVGKSISAQQLDVSAILQTVTDATTQVSGAAFGAFFYNTMDSNGKAYTLFAVSGVPREEFEKFGMPRNTEVFNQTFSGEGILRSDDITNDPRYGKNSPHHGMPNGQLPVVSYLAVPVVSKSGIVIGGLFFGHPEPARFKGKHEALVAAIASQAALALDNARLYEEVHALNSRKDEFIGFASHELKTPLTTISGYLQLAETSPELSAEFVPRISKQISRLSGIVSDLLDISKIQAGKLELNFTRTSLNTLIKEGVESVHATSHKIRYELPKEDIFIMVDVTKMAQVLVNVISNAMKYSPENTEITVMATRYGNEIRISIIDQGMGIPATDLENIFSQFYRVTPNINKQQGMGLGLYISKEIVDGHSGKIWTESVEGKGSTFHIHFPIDNKSI